MLLDIKRILVLFFGNAFWVVALKMGSFINFQSAFKLDNTASKGIRMQHCTLRTLLLQGVLKVEYPQNVCLAPFKDSLE